MMTCIYGHVDIQSRIDHEETDEALHMIWMSRSIRYDEAGCILSFSDWSETSRLTMRKSRPPRLIDRLRRLGFQVVFDEFAKGFVVGVFGSLLVAVPSLAPVWLALAAFVWVAVIY